MVAIPIALQTIEQIPPLLASATSVFSAGFRNPASQKGEAVKQSQRFSSCFSSVSFTFCELVSDAESHAPAAELVFRSSGRRLV